MSKMIKVEKEVPELNYELMEGMVKHTQGQVLTILEATLDDARRLEAAKSLIKEKFNDTLTRMFEIYMYQGDIPEGRIPAYER